jgi:hypothetical protein
MTTPAVQHAVDAAFGEERGRVVATLIRRAGDWDMTGECAQEAFTCITRSNVRARRYHPGHARSPRTVARALFPAAPGAGPAMLAGEMVHRVRAELPAVGGLGEREQRDRTAVVSAGAWPCCSVRICGRAAVIPLRR